MRILIAPDKFKGSLEASEVAASIASGLRDVLPDAVIDSMPVADGGEGTSAVIREAYGGESVNCAAHDALGRPIEARYLWLPDSATAVIEMSEAAGSRRLADSERDLLRADTYGVGEMIEHAVARSPKEIIVGLGGSATNDGGFGMARALGYRFYSSISVFTWLGKKLSGEKMPDTELTGPVDELQMLESIRRPDAVRLPKITAAVDVQNPLLGPRGATRTFGGQKGGTPEQLEILELALARLASIVGTELDSDFEDTPGAGAAGGLGFGLLSFCGATIRPGFDLVAEILGLEAAIERADIVITGEGCLDRQTLEGKAPAGVAHLARKMGKRVFAIAGCATGNDTLEMFDGVFLLETPPVGREEAMARAKELLRIRAKQLAREL